jgi:hypothetical protein
MMGQRRSRSECQKKQMPPEAPSVNLQQEGVQSASKRRQVTPGGLEWASYNSLEGCH